MANAKEARRLTNQLQVRERFQKWVSETAEALNLPEYMVWDLIADYLQEKGKV